MLVEMHCHTLEHSACSSLPALDLVCQVHARGLQGVVLTDHHYLWSDGELKELVARAALPSCFVIMAAQEVSTPEAGDVLVYGAGESIPAGTAVAEIRRRFPAAALVWAHPYRAGRRPAAAMLAGELLDAVEIFNSNHTARDNRCALEAWHRLKFTATAGTDTHAAGYAGIYPTLFQHPVAGIHELAGEIRSGRCSPYLQEVPRYGENTAVTELTIGIVEHPVNEPVIVKSARREEKWQAAQRAFRIMSEIHRHGFSGGRYRVPLPMDEDPQSRTVMEERLTGSTLFEVLQRCAPEEGVHALRLSAQWLARLHHAGLQVTPADTFLRVEEKRLEKYVRYFEAAGHPHTCKARALRDELREEEERLLERERERFVQGHGDFHPKNIFIGRDQDSDPAGRFVAAIDFDSSYCQPKAFDVAYFLTQFRNQFFAQPEILVRYPEEIFLREYEQGAGVDPADFRRQVALFRARAGLNITSFLVDIGKGNHPDVWRILVESEQSLAAWLSGR